jgi:hypothetical protein
MPRSMGFSQRRRPVWWRLALLAVAAIAVAAAAVAGAARLADSSPAASSPAARPTATTTGPYCPQLVIPAYFYSSSIWARAADSKPPPRDIILDISGLGAGNAPEAHFEAVVRQVKAKGITILGYISTVDGQRPAAQVETEVRNYKAWYGVTGIFLDRVSGVAPQVAYYRQLVSYIHQFNKGSSVWLNPGQYPDQKYMSIGDVVMVFEGTYAQYLSLNVPSWAGKYPASSFAHTIYATPSSGLSHAFELAASRLAGHVYMTSESGSNPYDALPSYWSREVSTASAGCAHR